MGAVVALRQDIQGLRTIAVGAVIADHLIGWPNGGFVGVDVFFVISGFLITGLLLREYERRGTISFRDFYERRAKRILPVAMFVLFATVCFTFALFGLGRTKDVVKDSIASALFAGNWHFARSGVDYFQEGQPPSPVQHYWSLAVEEQFYVVWPWLMLAALVLAARLPGWTPARARPIAGRIIAGLTLMSVVWALRETSASPTLAYFSTLSRAWELGLGALVAVGSARLGTVPQRVRGPLQWAGLAGIALAIVITPDSGGFPAPWATLAVLSTVVVIAAGTGSQSQGPWVLANPASQYLGAISYSLYLWHFPVVVLLLAVFAEASIAYVVGGLVLTLALSSASYRFLEDPARKADWFRRSGGGWRPAPGWIRAGSACVAVAVIAGGVFAVATAVSPRPAVVAPQVLAGGTLDDPGDCFGAAALDPNHVCRGVNDPNGGILPAPADLADDTGDAYDCYSGLNAAMRSCTLGTERDGTIQVALVGDSHAAVMAAAVAPQLEAANWSLTTFVGRGCRLYEPSERPDQCSVARPDIVRELSSGRFDIIVATATRKNPASVAQHRAALEELIEAGQRVVVVEDNPSVPKELIACATRLGYQPTRDCSVSRESALSAKDPLAAAGRQISVPVVDLTDLYCTANRCPSTVGNVSVYRDSAGHVSTTFARTLGPYIVEALQRIPMVRSNR